MKGPGNAVTDPETGLIYAPNRYDDSRPSMLVYNPTDNSISKADMHPDLIGNKGFSAVWSTVRKSILVFGGLKGNTSESSTLYEYTPGKGWTIPVVQGDLPKATYRHRMVPAYNGKLMVLFGGIRSQGEIYFLDTTTLTWSTGTPGGPVYAREYPACATSGDMFVVWGGKLATGVIAPLNVTGVYNMRERRWQQTFEPPATAPGGPSPGGPSPGGPSPGGSHEETPQPGKPANLSVILGCTIPAAIILLLAGFVFRRQKLRKREKDMNQHATNSNVLDGKESFESNHASNMELRPVSPPMEHAADLACSPRKTTVAPPTPFSHNDKNTVGDWNHSPIQLEAISKTETSFDKDGQGYDSTGVTQSHHYLSKAPSVPKPQEKEGESWKELHAPLADRLDYGGKEIACSCNMVSSGERTNGKQKVGNDNNSSCSICGNKSNGINHSRGPSPPQPAVFQYNQHPQVKASSLPHSTGFNTTHDIPCGSHQSHQAAEILPYNPTFTQTSEVTGKYSTLLPQTRMAQQSQQEEYLQSLHQDIMKRQQTLARLEEEQERQLRALHGIAATTAAINTSTAIPSPFEEYSSDSTLVPPTTPTLYSSQSPTSLPHSKPPIPPRIPSSKSFKTTTTRAPAVISDDATMLANASSSISGSPPIPFATKPRAPQTILDGPSAFPTLGEARGPHSPPNVLPAVTANMQSFQYSSSANTKEEL
ncbi:hypothetical protein BGW41_006561 [Actinomortierella wolfii]|nr:hypothetical protein BGW41_006561 [Actinomortierella wolfii]